MNAKQELIISKLQKMKLFIEFLGLKLKNTELDIERLDISKSHKIALIQKSNLKANRILKSVLDLYNYRLEKIQKL